ncbi:HK97-gp10 family putative phage morphogenesis protein [Liquorilactobacillus capillatus]|uniref:Phage-related head-tail joining protein n=1 Tax=Liquorilactobacillus capillatus DSM 19910 TaxID=1423731 RepID=A0A0R1MCH5_9LACO|nr:HK97-gp10 family putative phage morphogenesis protein [Liquorilactobacillus capillatus]KRL02981.1 phage-related head-tail joining protein [Liquorilactobacillus capillatus DSM 19910]
MEKDDLGLQLEAWLEAAKDLVPDSEDAKKITNEGAGVLAKHLKAEADKHRSTRKDVKYGHLADNIVVQNTDIDGEKNGNSVVGFGQKAYVARFLNDGTKNMAATHFVDNARREAKDDVLKAQWNKYKEITRKKRSE